MELENVSAEIRSVNVRKEFHGEDRVLAADVKFLCTAGADILAHFHPRLRDTLFDTGAVRMPQLGKFDWSATFQNMEIKFAKLAFTEATLKGFQFEAKADGTEDSEGVEMTFTASFEPRGGQVDKLANLLMETVQLSTSPQQGALPL